MSGTIRVLAEQGIPHEAAPYVVASPEIHLFIQRCRQEDLCHWCGAELPPWHERGSTVSEEEDEDGAVAAWGANHAQVAKLNKDHHAVLIGGPLCLDCGRALNELRRSRAPKESPCPSSST